MYYDSEIVANMAHTLNQSGLGQELCEKILPCGVGDLAMAVMDGDMRSVLGMLAPRRAGSDKYPGLECQAERLRYLCLAVSEEMRREALNDAMKVRHPAAEQARICLVKRDPDAARAVLCVTSGVFKYSIPLRRLDGGFEPEPGYMAIENAVPYHERNALRRLAYIVSRLPTC